MSLDCLALIVGAASTPSVKGSLLYMTLVCGLAASSGLDFALEAN